jgi:hypothetical protein
MKPYTNSNFALNHGNVTKIIVIKHMLSPKGIIDIIDQSLSSLESATPCKIYIHGLTGSTISPLLSLCLPPSELPAGNLPALP